VSKRMAVVAVETNLLGRIVIPTGDPTAPHLWPFHGTGLPETQAEIVAAFVGDLDEGGEIKFILRGCLSGALRRCYSHGFLVPEGSE
jgi:hypothetical protein